MVHPEGQVRVTHCPQGVPLARRVTAGLLCIVLVRCQGRWGLPRGSGLGCPWLGFLLEEALRLFRCPLKGSGVFKPSTFEESQSL